jgi:hypothetical protein
LNITFKVENSDFANLLLKQVHSRLRIGLDHATTEVKAEMKSLLRGDVSSKTLAKWGHPYASGRGPATRFSASRGAGRRRILGVLPINNQTGKLLASLSREDTNGYGTLRRKLFFTSPHAFVLSPGGLPNMVPREYWEHIYSFAHESLARNVKVALNSKS